MARLQAREYRVLAALAARSDARLPANAKPKEIEIARRTLAAELGVACRVSDRTMTVRLAAAETLLSKFPLTLEALGRGLDRGRARAHHHRVRVGHHRRCCPGRV